MIKVPNESLMTNRRCLTPLVAGKKIGRASYAPAPLSAAVAYLFR
jgi:hypothetical protein